MTSGADFWIAFALGFGVAILVVVAVALVLWILALRAEVRGERA